MKFLEFSFNLTTFILILPADYIYTYVKRGLSFFCSVNYLTGCVVIVEQQRNEEQEHCNTKIIKQIKKRFQGEMKRQVLFFFFFTIKLLFNFFLLKHFPVLTSFLN